MRATRIGLSLVEVVFAALIIGFSALPILNLVRSGTVAAQVTEVEAAARALAGDVLERLAARADRPDAMAIRVVDQLKGMSTRWADLYDDKFLKHGFPFPELAPILNKADMRIAVRVEAPAKHAVFRGLKHVRLFEITASWTHRLDVRREVKLARLVED